MTDVALALHTFFSSFGIPDYVENTVPDDAVFPYITHQIVQPEWRDSSLLYARVWYRSMSIQSLCTKVDEIASAVGEGMSIPTSNGAVYLSKGTPFVQFMPMEGDDMLKVAYLNFIINAITM